MILYASQLQNKIRYINEHEIRTNCVFCLPKDTKQHLYINLNKKVFHCFKCGASGKFITEDSIKPPVTKHYETPNSLADVPDYQLEYLINRGLNTQDLLLYSPISYSKYPLYIFSNLSSLKVGRNVFDKEPKYIKSNINGLPWGYELLPKESFDELFLVEGTFDFIAVHNYLQKPVVALLGKTLSPTQKSYILSLPVKKIKIMLDADAYEFASKIYQSLRLWKEVEIIKLEDDPWNDRLSLRRFL